MTARRRCTVEDCNRPVKGNGLCSMHYARVRRHGSIDGPKRIFRPWEDLMIRRLQRTPDGRCQYGALKALAARLGRSVSSVEGRLRRLRLQDANKPKVIYRITPRARRQWHSAKVPVAVPEPPPEPHLATFTIRTRPCASCGRPFETTPERRLLCLDCFRGED